MTDNRKSNANTNLNDMKCNNLNNNNGDGGDDKRHSTINNNNNNNNDKFSINNNNNTEIVAAVDAGYSGTKVHRMRSISVVNQRGPTIASGIDGGTGGSRVVGCGSSMLLHSHCLDNMLTMSSKAKCQTHPHRSRSKTVSCDLHKCHAHDALIKRRTCQHTVAGKSQLLDADRLNGNVIEGVPCTARDIPTRLLQRNRSQVNSRYMATPQPQQQPQTSHSSPSNKAAIANHLIKRGKRTLSSTQIEREKGDEKSVKVIKKAAALRSLSPLLGANTRSAKKLVAPTNAK